MRLLWVVPRFKHGIVGGAETLVRGLATHAPPGWRVEVATTCATDHVSWTNALEPGTAVDEGITTHRFLVGPRDAARFEQLHHVIVSGTASYADELEWLANSVWAPGLQRFIVERADDYDLIIFCPYFFGTTVWGAQAQPDRAVLMPCLHDEPYAYLETIARLFRTTRGCLFNSEPERQLAERLYGPNAGFVVGMGFDAPTEPTRARFGEGLGNVPYLLYAGRLEEGKRVDVAVDFAVRHAQLREDAPKLVLIGSGTYQAPASAGDTVVEIGLVDEEERRAAYGGALALVNPSHLESLSLVLLESWLEETPALVAGGSDVLRHHCERSGGGFTFDSYDEYEEAVNRLMEDPQLAKEMGRAGAAYVLREYSWSAVGDRLRAAVEGLAS